MQPQPTPNPFTRYRHSKCEFILEAIRKYRDSEKQIRVKKNENLISADFVCCTPEQNVREAAEIMVKYDCGRIAVVESGDNLKPLGVITDRDITWRVVASGKTPEQTSVRDVMSSLL